MSTPQDRDSWVEHNMDRFMELCNTAYQDGDFSYVKTLLLANHEGMGEFLNNRTNAGNRTVTGEESFHIIKSLP